jgi:hypothetical protein
LGIVGVVVFIEKNFAFALAFIAQHISDQLMWVYSVQEMEQPDQFRAFSRTNRRRNSARALLV